MACSLRLRRVFTGWTPAGRIRADLPAPFAATAGGSDWLFPGVIADQPLSPEQLRRRLKALGINAREIPAPILASMLGIVPITAARWSYHD